MARTQTIDGTKKLTGFGVSDVTCESTCESILTNISYPLELMHQHRSSKFNKGNLIGSPGLFSLTAHFIFLPNCSIPTDMRAIKQKSNSLRKEVKNIETYEI